MNKFIQFFSFLFVITLLPAFTWAQIDLNSAGRVSIGTSPNSNNQLRVIASTEDIAVFARSASTGNYVNYGVRGEASNGYDSYGLYGSASGAIANYGVYGTASGGSYNWAGYFNGSVYTTGSYQSSDERLKKNIQPLDNKEILTNLTQVTPRRYEYLTADELRAQDLPALNTKKGEHFGFLAQELEAVFPELVTEVRHVLNEGTDKLNEAPQTVTTKAINYQELTVLLLAAVQELKAEVETLKTQLNEER